MKLITSKVHIQYTCSKESPILKPKGLKQTPTQAVKYQYRQIKSANGIKMVLQANENEDENDNFDEYFQVKPIHYFLNNPQFNKPDTLCRFSNPLLLYRECVKYPQNCAHDIFTITKNSSKRKFNTESLQNFNVQQVAKNVYATKLTNLFKYLKINNQTSEIDIEFLNRQYMDSSPADLSKIFKMIQKCKNFRLNIQESLLNTLDFGRLGQAFSHFANLEYLDLDLACNTVQVEEIKHLTNGLKICKKIKIFKLNFDESALNDEAITELHRFISEEVPLLETYKFRSFWNQFSQGVMQSLGPALAKKDKLKELEFYNECGSIDFKAFISILEGLAECPNFISLKLMPQVALENKDQLESMGIAIGKLTNLRELSFSSGRLRRLTTVEYRNSLHHQNHQRIQETLAQLFVGRKLRIMLFRFCAKLLKVLNS